MYRITTALLILACLSSCSSSRVVPLSAHYQPDPVITQNISGISGDEVWTRIVRFFADHNLPIKTIDKSSGFIQSDILSFVKAYEIDSDSVHLAQPPYVIAQRETAYDMTIQPSYITGYLKIFLLTDKNSTQVRVQVEDLKNYHLLDVHHKHSPVTHDEIPRSVVSTSVFENQISQYINTGIDTAFINIQKGEILNPKNNYAQYIKKKTNRTLAAFLGGELGGIAVVGTTMALLLKKH